MQATGGSGKPERNLISRRSQNSMQIVVLEDIKGSSKSLPRLPYVGVDFKNRNQATQSLPNTPSRGLLLQRRKGWRELPHLQVPQKSQNLMGFVPNTPFMPVPLQSQFAPTLDLGPKTPTTPKIPQDPYQVLLTPQPSKMMVEEDLQVHIPRRRNHRKNV
mmetsp:Transcript_18307/g.36932  ORF Transcript_18307/g.36932 Transcript_18307/m.36932 type:complete len:160 (-) Transcript_18307:296-775(-)